MACVELIQFVSIFGIKGVAQQHRAGNAQNQARVVIHLHATIHAQPVGGILGVVFEVQHHPVALRRQNVVKVVGRQRDGRHAAQQPGARHGHVLVVDAQKEGGKQQPPAEAAQINAAPLRNNLGVRLLLVGGQCSHVVLHQFSAVAHVGAVRHAREQGGGDAATHSAALNHVVLIGGDWMDGWMDELDWFCEKMYIKCI